MNTRWFCDWKVEKSIGDGDFDEVAGIGNALSVGQPRWAREHRFNLYFNSARGNVSADCGFFGSPESERCVFIGTLDDNDDMPGYHHILGVFVCGDSHAEDVLLAFLVEKSLLKGGVVALILQTLSKIDATDAGATVGSMAGPFGDLGSLHRTGVWHAHPDL